METVEERLIVIDNDISPVERASSCDTTTDFPRRGIYNSGVFVVLIDVTRGGWVAVAGVLIIITASGGAKVCQHLTVRKGSLGVPVEVSKAIVDLDDASRLRQCSMAESGQQIISPTGW